MSGRATTTRQTVKTVSRHSYPATSQSASLPFPRLTRRLVNFNVTIPDTLGSSCDEAGKCVIQWYWYASEGDQTYISCVDFFTSS